MVVELCYYERYDYPSLTTPQKDELCEWRKQQKNNYKVNGNISNGSQKWISGLQMAKNKDKNNVTISALNTDIISLK